jgi:basic membrane lipoprotein Med (substrate-binding protein (PBP1-ABC) superfamily)
MLSPLTRLWNTHRRAALAGVLSIVVALAGLVVWLSQSGPAPVKPFYANISRNFKVCFLTTADTTDSGLYWSAVQAARTHAAINAQRIVAPPSTIGDLTPYLNSFIAQHCGLIVTAGSPLHQAVTTVARTQPHQQFLDIGGTNAQGNLYVLPATSNTAAITSLITATAHTTSER